MRQKRYIKVSKGARIQFFRAQSSERSEGVSTKKFGFEPLVIVGFFLFSFFLMFHTFGYDSVQKNILIARTLWSDFGSHIPLIRSFSMGNNFPPQYPIFPGEPIRYHFLFYMLVGYLEKIGLRLDWALNLPSALGFFLLLWGIWTLAKKLFGDTRVAFLSVLFFLCNGSLSFIKFFSRRPLTLSTFPAFGPWDGGVISAFWNLNIYTNQRHLAWGFAIGVWFLVWVISSKKSIPGAILWGIILGILPYFHQPMLLIMAILMGTNFIFFPRLRMPILISASIGLLFIAPQLTSMFLPFARHPGLDPGSSSFLLWIPAFAGMTIEALHSFWFPGYLVHEHLSILTFLNFWVQNLGLHAFLIPIGFFLIPKNARRILFPIIILFVIGNLFKFSMEVAANHKFFNFAALLGNMVSAYTIVILFMSHPRVREDPENNKTLIHYFLRWIPAFAGMTKSVGMTKTLSSSRTRGSRGENIILRWIPAFAGMTKSVGMTSLVILLTLSGIIDFLVIVNDNKGTLADVNNNQTATWIAANTPKDAIFLNSSFLYHPASLAGRKVFLGWPYFAWSAGYDTYKRNDEMRLMYESKDPNVFCPLLAHHQISYITVENTKGDPNLPNIDVAYFRDAFPSIFEDSGDKLRIYQTSSLCP